MSNVTQMLRDLDVEEFLVESVEVDPMLIQDHYTTIASQFAYWSHQYALADKNMKLAKMEEERCHATSAIRHRQVMLDAGLKVTEAQVEAKVVTDPEMIDLAKERIEAEFQRERLRGVVNALSIKNQSLMSLGAHVRKEMEGDPLVRKAYANAAAAGGYGPGGD